MIELLIFLAIALWIHGPYGEFLLGKSRLDEEAERIEKGCAILILAGVGTYLLAIHWLHWW